MSIIVSLTSTSGRLPVLKYTLISILDQRLQPDKVVLCISRTKYLLDEGITELPPWLSSMADSEEIEIKWVENTGSYRKLLPVYSASSSQDWIITCDDDVIYGPDWLLSIVKSAENYPDAIICGRARMPVRTPWGGIQSYLNWPLAPLGAEGLNLLPTGVSGILYRKSLLDHGVMSSTDYKKLAPKQDDLWFNLARQVAGTKVVVSTETGKHVFPVAAPGAALSETNASTELAGWHRLAHALSERLLLKTKGYLGFPVCGNDIVLRKLEKYRLSR